VCNAVLLFEMINEFYGADFHRNQRDCHAERSEASAFARELFCEKQIARADYRKFFK